MNSDVWLCQVCHSPRTSRASPRPFWSVSSVCMPTSTTSTLLRWYSCKRRPISTPPSSTSSSSSRSSAWWTSVNLRHFKSSLINWLAIDDLWEQLFTHTCLLPFFRTCANAVNSGGSLSLRWGECIERVSTLLAQQSGVIHHWSRGSAKLFMIRKVINMLPCQLHNLPSEFSFGFGLLTMSRAKFIIGAPTCLSECVRCLGRVSSPTPPPHHPKQCTPTGVTPPSKCIHWWEWLPSLPPQATDGSISQCSLTALWWPLLAPSIIHQHTYSFKTLAVICKKHVF